MKFLLENTEFIQRLLVWKTWAGGISLLGRLDEGVIDTHFVGKCSGRI